MSGNGKGPAEIKAAAFKLTDLDFEGRTFEGYAAFFNNVDAYGDIIHPGAFVKTLVERGQKVKLLWQHDTAEPIGRPLELREDGSGLFIKAIISDTARGRDALALLQDNAINEMSIGYDAIRGGVDYTKVGEDTLRNLRELRLWEVSLVSFPANEMAQVTALKENEAASRDKAAGADMDETTEKPDADGIQDADVETTDDDGVAEAEKAGPIISAKGAAQIGGAFSALARALTDAGIEVAGFGAEEPADVEDEADSDESVEKGDSAPAPEQAAIEQREQDELQAGPDDGDKSSAPPTSSNEILLKTIELELATNNLLEVECG